MVAKFSFIAVCNLAKATASDFSVSSFIAAYVISTVSPLKFLITLSLIIFNVYDIFGFIEDGSFIYLMTIDVTGTFKYCAIMARLLDRVILPAEHPLNVMEPSKILILSKVLESHSKTILSVLPSTPFNTQFLSFPILHILMVG